MGGGEKKKDDLQRVVKKILNSKPEIGRAVIEITQPEYAMDGTGQRDCLPALREAIMNCHRDGGGRVVVPPSAKFYRLDGPLVLMSTVILDLQRGCILRFTPKPELYRNPRVWSWFESSEVRNYSPLIYAHRQENLGIIGDGIIDGQGHIGDDGGEHVWHSMAEPSQLDAARLRKMNDDEVPLEERRFPEQNNLRPNFIEFFDCKRVLLEGVTIRNPPMLAVHPVLCESVIVRNITITGEGYNNSGVNPEMSTDVLIEDCDFHTSDYGVGIKAGRGMDGRRYKQTCSNIVVRRCTVHPCPKAPEGARCGLSIGSEGSAGIRDVWVEDCVIKGRQRGISIMSSLSCGGLYENLRFRRVSMEDISQEGMKLCIDADGGYDGDCNLPTFKNIELDGIQCLRAKNAGIDFRGLPESLIRDVSVRCCTFTDCGPSTIMEVAGLEVDKVNFNRVGTCFDGMCSIM